MAATRLIVLHVNKGKSVAQCLRARTDYVQNPEKTDNGELVTAYESTSPASPASEQNSLSKKVRWYSS